MYCRTVKFMLLINFGSTTSLLNNLKMFTGYRTVRTVYKKMCTLPLLFLLKRELWGLVRFWSTSSKQWFISCKKIGHTTINSASVADPGCLSRIRFFHPGSWIPDMHQRNSAQKMVSKISEIRSGLFIPDPDPDFLPIPDPGYRGQKGTGSRILVPGAATLNSARNISQTTIPCIGLPGKRCGGGGGGVFNLVF